jgi:hypothetical protein
MHVPQVKQLLAAMWGACSAREWSCAASCTLQRRMPTITILNLAEA